MTSMKESERYPWQVEEEKIQRQEESQEGTKSRSPGARNFKGVGWGSQQNKMPQSHQFSQIWKVCVELGGHT